MVIDTNVLVASYLSKTHESPNFKIVKLWRQRKLQLIITDEIENEYLEVFERLEIPDELTQRFKQRLKKRETVTHVNLGKRFTESRDPKDNPFLSTSARGNAQFLISNDTDLLHISTEDKKKFKFEIVTPQQFLDLVLKMGFD